MRNRFLSAAVVAGIVAGLTSGAVITMGPASVPLIGDAYASHVEYVDCFGLPNLTLWQAYGLPNAARDECEGMKEELRRGEQLRLVAQIKELEAKAAASKAKREALDETRTETP